MDTLRVAGVAAVAASVFMAGLRAQDRERVTTHDGVVRVEIEEISNALSSALYEVSGVCRCVISYEDPEWSFSGDLAQQPDGRGGSLWIARKSRLDVSVPTSLPLTRESAADLVERLIVEDARNGGSARFEVFQGRTLEVRPTRVKDRDGVEREATLLLDTPISLRRGQIDASNWLRRIAGEISRATGKDVSGIWAPGGPYYRDLITLEAEHEPARVVLDRLLAQLPRPAGWAVEFIPSMNRFSLAVRVQRIVE